MPAAAGGLRLQSAVIVYSANKVKTREDLFRVWYLATVLKRTAD